MATNDRERGQLPRELQPLQADRLHASPRRWSLSASHTRAVRQGPGMRGSCWSEVRRVRFGSHRLERVAVPVLYFSPALSCVDQSKRPAHSRRLGRHLSKSFFSCSRTKWPRPGRRLRADGQQNCQLVIPIRDSQHSWIHRKLVSRQLRPRPALDQATAALRSDQPARLAPRAMVQMQSHGKPPPRSGSAPPWGPPAQDTHCPVELGSSGTSAPICTPPLTRDRPLRHGG